MISHLNMYTTSDVITLQPKGVNAYEAENMNNYMIQTNNDFDDSGRRFFVLDINTSKRNDNAYWDRLRGACFNDECGKAFGSFLHTIDLSGYRDQAFPVTQNKLSSIANNINTTYYYIKAKYVLRKVGIDMKPKDAYNDYVAFTKKNEQHPESRERFFRFLTERGIGPKKISTNIIKYSYETLLEVAKREKWISDIDEFEDTDDPEPEERVYDAKQTEKTINDLLMLLYVHNIDLPENITNGLNDFTDLVIPNQVMQQLEQPRLKFTKKSKTLLTP